MGDRLLVEPVDESPKWRSFKNIEARLLNSSILKSPKVIVIIG